jgi:putative ABC transport system permease protein
VMAPGYSPTNQRDSLVWFNEVSDGYFATFGTALLAGREFRPADIGSAHRVAIINETVAKRFFAGVDPVGRSFRMRGGHDTSPPIEVIGVVQDAKYQHLDEKTLPTAYVPLGQADWVAHQATYEIRTAASTAAVTPAVRAVAAAINPAISLGITTMEAQVSSSLARPRLLATLSAFFGALALLLAVVGLYGTMSYNVTRRKNEIGIRMALGAARQQVLRMVVREAGRLIAAGIVVGALLAFAGTRFVASMLYGVTPTDPATFALSALALGAVAMAAAMLPAWRAARLDPMEALREE